MIIKERQRYILFKIVSDGEIGEQQVIRAVWRHLFQLYGEFGTSQTGLWLIEYKANEYGIIRTNISSLPMVRTTLAVIHTIEGRNCLCSVQAVSGTIKSLKTKHLSDSEVNEEIDSQ
ncbi:MAG TPA: Rpp14/Pop5 family protein [Candidatus Deferrimicrobium sp.]|nr:Rpp14/Pop5 family protein [Candidatus Deferrimicrobium sp.]